MCAPPPKGRRGYVECPLRLFLQITYFYLYRHFLLQNIFSEEYTVFHYYLILYTSPIPTEMTFSRFMSSIILYNAWYLAL